MTSRSKQPNDFDQFSDADQGMEDMDREWSLSADEGDSFLLAGPGAEAGSGGGQQVREGGYVSPSDFSADEVALARDLQGLFPVEQEQLPPYFIQTITSESCPWAAPPNLAQHVTADVFQRLHLPQRLFRQGSSVPAQEPRGFIALRRAPQRIALNALLAVLLLTLVTVAPSFAQGLRMLLGHTGVQMMSHYPQTIISPHDLAQPLSLQEVNQAASFKVSWLGPTPGSYQYAGLLLHIGQPWAAGPVVEIQYTHSDLQTGFGPLDVREFRPAAGSTVLQVVAQGAAHSVQVGDQQAIYIDGQWVQQHMAIVWESGTRSELLYQSHGVIFWITADQRDGMGEEALTNLALSLTPLDPELVSHMLPDPVLPIMGEVTSALSSASLGEVIALISAGTSPETGAAVFIAEGSPLEDDV